MKSIKEEVEIILNQRGFMDLRAPLERIKGVKHVDFQFSPIPHYSFNYEGKQYLIGNATYFEGAELVVNDTAFGEDA